MGEASPRERAPSGGRIVLGEAPPQPAEGRAHVSPCMSSQTDRQTKITAFSITGSYDNPL